MNDLRRAFTFIEVAVVIIVIGILAAIVVPRFGNVTDEARTSASQATLASVRASIAAFRTARVLAGGSPYPTHAELTTLGTVTENEVPANPFSGVPGVQLVTANAAALRQVTNPAQYGWNYYVDNAATPPVAVFYSNCETLTTVTDSNGDARKASEL
ncbi:MAG: prepilin-type N-terminal cleavage/methylation domain-containing protein [Tepidisphaera sp.]